MVLLVVTASFITLGIEGIYGTADCEPNGLLIPAPGHSSLLQAITNRIRNTLRAVPITSRIRPLGSEKRRFATFLSSKNKVFGTAFMTE